MEKKNKVAKVYFGGWYQRTTLHLSEIYDFLAYGKSNLPLNEEKLKKFYQEMQIESITREAGYLEYISATTSEGIEVRYYEDGLYVFGLVSEDVESAKKTLDDFYNLRFAPGIAYIFSLGAPTPKELANIKSNHPIAAVVYDKDPSSFVLDESKYGKVYSNIGSEGFNVLKTGGYIFLVAKEKNDEAIVSLLEMQIFFREFKDQLQKYLDVHRSLWEKISQIKEQKMIKGADVEDLRMQLDAYQKTINLIGSRINQMGTYVHTRADISKEMKLTEHLANVFQYKFDVLTNTHRYVQEIWVMTTNYLNTAIQVIGDIKSQATNKSIQSLQLITTYGVVGGVIGYLSKDSLPVVTGNGLIYFGFLMVATYLVNKLVSFAYTKTKYKMTFSERVKDL